MLEECLERARDGEIRGIAIVTSDTLNVVGNAFYAGPGCMNVSMLGELYLTMGEWRDLYVDTRSKPRDATFLWEYEEPGTDDDPVT